MNVQTNSSTAISFSPAISLPRVWQRVALGAILVAAIFLHFYRLDQEGFANLYYAATVKSMLTSWHNFFFASFDPAGFVSVDKPPLGFWIQALSATLFGFNGISLLLPQALAGVLSVALIYFLVARVFGTNAGLIAALVLTLTPISIASNRNNTVDSLLVFTSLLAAWAVTIAIEKGSARWLIACALLVGIGFNIKELQAILVLPAFWLAYLVAANARWWKRIAHLFIATIILLIVSLAWVVAVDLTPRDQRPFVGSSQNNTEMELIVGHNGVQRLGIIANWLGLRDQPRAQNDPANSSANIQSPAPKTDSQNPPPNSQPKQLFDAPPNPPANAQPKQPFDNPPPNAENNLPRGPNDETGLAGAWRLFNPQLAGQTSWLLPFALIGFFAAAWQTRVRVPFAREHQQLLLWGMWLVPQIIFFSYAGLFHRYYLEMLSPAIAALVGAGMVALWRDYR
ncbi:MAG: glycosyltransferase family 39 protein, partial [Chloroflexi bacterium]|nr:glycosyltransferase family 39 protein [Chloroflexota bacterium]